MEEAVHLGSFGAQKEHFRGLREGQAAVFSPSNLTVAGRERVHIYKNLLDSCGMLQVHA